jgi:hypothetical protein
MAAEYVPLIIQQIGDNRIKRKRLNNGWEQRYRHCRK